MAAPCQIKGYRQARSEAEAGRAPPGAEVRVERVFVGRLGLCALSLGAQRRNVGRLGAVQSAR